MPSTLTVKILERRRFVLFTDGYYREIPYYEAAAFFPKVGLRPTHILRKGDAAPEFSTIPALKAAARSIAIKLGYNRIIYERVKTRLREPIPPVAKQDWLEDPPIRRFSPSVRA